MQLSNILYKLSGTAIITALLCGCVKNDVDLPEQNQDDYNLVYMPQAVNNPVIANLIMKGEEQSVIYGASFGGVGYPAEDISVNFSAAPNLVDSFNRANSTSYPVLPAESYSLSESSAVIAKGTLSTAPLELKIKTEGVLELFKEYLLPVTMTMPHNISSVKENMQLATTFYVVKGSLDLADFPDYDRSKWKVIDFSSEEANGEGAGNGHAIHAIDNDKNTFWHTQWQGASPGLPHHITIDMEETKTIHGFSFIPRQNSNAGRPKDVTLQTSTDGTNWVDAGNMMIENSNDFQKKFLLTGFKEARYFKLTITSTHGGANYTHMAELGAF